DVAHPAGVADVVDRDDVGMLELGRDHRLALEAVHQLFEARAAAGGEALESDRLDGDHAAEDLVLGLVDGAERPRAQTLDDLVALRDLARVGRARRPLLAHAPLSGGPAQLAATHEVQVDVVDAVAGVLTVVEDEPVAALLEPLGLGEVARAP